MRKWNTESVKKKLLQLFDGEVELVGEFIACNVKILCREPDLQNPTFFVEWSTYFYSLIKGHRSRQNRGVRVSLSINKTREVKVKRVSMEQASSQINKCKYLTEFVKKYPDTYESIRKRKNYFALTKSLIRSAPDFEKHRHVIYLYEFSDGHCYVGQSISIVRRRLRHLSKGPVYNHSQQTGLTPSFSILEENIKTKDLANREQYWQDLYERTHKKLWKARAGSIGSSGAASFDYGFCLEIYSAANCTKELRSTLTGRRVYDKAISSGWHKQLSKDWPVVYRRKESITYEHCVSVYSKLTTIEELKQKDNKLYITARVKGWHKELSTHFNRSIIHWTYEKCKDLYIQCDGRKDLLSRNNGPKCYDAAKRNGWHAQLKDFFKNT